MRATKGVLGCWLLIRPFLIPTNNFFCKWNKKWLKKKLNLIWKDVKNDIESSVVWKLQLMGRMIEKVKVPSYRSRKNCISWERSISAWNHLGEVYYGGAGFTAVQFYQIVMPSVITRRHDNDVCFNLWSSLWPYYIFAEGKCLFKTNRVKLCSWASSMNFPNKLYSYFAFLLLAFLCFELVLY